MDSLPGILPRARGPIFMSDLIKEAKTYFTAEEMATLIRWKYPSKEYVVLDEVRDSTGFSGRGRSADAVAFGIWPSRGLTITGFEFKSSRSDWTRELANPEKAESIAQYCDAWWLVAAENVAKIEEIPATWGWYAPIEKKGGDLSLKVMRVPRFGSTNGGKAPPREFLMSVLRNMRDSTAPKADIPRLAEEMMLKTAEQRDYKNKRRLERAAELEKVFADFKKASGIDLAAEWGYPAYPPKLVGAAVRALVEGHLQTHIKNVESAAEAARGMLAALQAVPIELKGDE